MVNAIFSEGGIRPLDPLPLDWEEGQALRVEKVEEDEMTAEEIDRAFAAMEQLAQGKDASQDEILQHALDQAKAEAKAYMRRKMGLE